MPSIFKNRKKLFNTWLALIVLGALFLSPSGLLQSGKSVFSQADAGFFSRDLELFEEVVGLVSSKYVYPPDYKKLFSLAIDEMAKTAGGENLSISPSPSGETIRWHNSELRYNLNYNLETDMDSFRKAYYFLLEESGGKMTPKELETAAVIGIMNSLDPYSQYLDKEAFAKSMRDTEGKYGGLGMVITMRDKKLIVVKTMKNSPAERAGILPDDMFLKVNGKGLGDMHIHDLAQKLRGYPNTKVSITLTRPSENREQTYNLTREIISIETVLYKTLENDIGYISISSFSKQTNGQLKEALARAKVDQAKAFILDLRDNPGGLLNQSVKVASHFLFRNRLIVYTQGRAPEDYKEYRAQYKNGLHQTPVVVLINQNSASASEIVAGALRDSGKALIIGQNSYGKGSVQTIFRVSDGSGLRLTTSKYYTPSGTDITEHGIVPEIKIVGDTEEPGDEKPEDFAPGPEILDQETLPILLTESEIEKYLKEKGRSIGEDHDPILHFARMLIENVTVANKKQTLEKARELAANIHY